MYNAYLVIIGYEIYYAHMYIVVFLHSVRFIADIAKNVPHGNGHFVAPIKCTNLEAFFAA